MTNSNLANNFAVISLITLNSFFLVFLLIYRMGPSIVDLDLWHGMALIREAVTSGQFPYADSFAYTETIYPVVHHEWGAGLIAFLISKYLGGNGIVALRFLLIGALFSLLIYRSWKELVRSSVFLFLLPIPIFIIANGTSTIRAQMYSFILAASLLIFLDIDSNNKRWWIPIWLVLYIFWLNIHGGFLVGLGWVFVYGVDNYIRGKPFKHIAFLLLAMVVLIIVNPYGIYYFSYLSKAINLSRPNVREWQNLVEGTNWGIVSFFVLSLILSIYSLIGLGMKRCDGALLLGVTAILSLKTNRIVFFYAIAWFYYVPAWLQKTNIGEAIINFYEKRKMWLCCIYTITICFFGFKILAFNPFLLRVPNSYNPEWGTHVYYPVGPVDYLANSSFKGNVLVPFDWGSYLTWKLYPNVKVSLDSRYEAAYPPHVEIEQFHLFMAEDGWRDILAEYCSDVILTNVRLPLSRELSKISSWKKVYADGQWEIYSPKDSIFPISTMNEPRKDGKFP